MMSDEIATDGWPGYPGRPDDPAPRTLVVEVFGGMGNQMFQYACACALARRTGVTLRVAFADYGRPFALAAFGIGLDGTAAAAGGSVEEMGGYRAGDEQRLEQAVRDQPAAMETVRLAGYFQNERYFESMAGEIRERFRLEPIRLAACAGRRAVGVHVRRGDFVGTGHELCTPRYYEQAMQRMRAWMPAPPVLFVVVSDDPEWCRTNLAPAADRLICEWQTTDLEAMRLLQGCEAFILSNSTFGWWAAWIADSPRVIAPSRFLPNPWDIVPERWLQLPPEGATDGDPAPLPAVVREEGSGKETEERAPKIGLVVIATGNYPVFLPGLLASADRYFLCGQEVEYLVFTDGEAPPEGCCRRRVRRYATGHEAWPMVTLRRYSTILTQAEALRDFSHLFYCDADMKFIGEVDEAILAPLVAVQHPGYHGTRGTPETRPESTAYVPESTPMQYFVGAFLGGETAAFLQMATTLAANIQRDLENGIIAVWHDESHSNRYLIDHPPSRILDAGYCWVPDYGLPFIPRLQALEKNHAEIRGAVQSAGD